MSTGHFVSHVGARNAPKVCWRVGCHQPATIQRNKRFYCAAHSDAHRHTGFNPPAPEVSLADVLAARAFLAEGGSLADAAKRRGVLTHDLDIALWRHLGSR